MSDRIDGKTCHLSCGQDLVFERIMSSDGSPCEQLSQILWHDGFAYAICLRLRMRSCSSTRTAPSARKPGGQASQTEGLPKVRCIMAPPALPTSARHPPNSAWAQGRHDSAGARPPSALCGIDVPCGHRPSLPVGEMSSLRLLAHELASRLELRCWRDRFVRIR